MSSFSPITYISELEDRFQHDRRLNILQEIDVVALDLVRKALRTKDLFAVVLVRTQCYLLLYPKQKLTECRTSRSTMRWFHLLLVPPRSTLTKWHMA